MIKSAPIVLAVDTNDIETAKQWVRATDGVISVVKLGLEFFLNFGTDGVKAIADSCQTDIFLDLKLHDIPHTVAGAARAVSNLRPKFLTVHASGGSAMVAAAVEAMPSTLITGVTILTSLSENDVEAIGFRSHALDSAVGLATVAVRVTVQLQCHWHSPLAGYLVTATPLSRQRQLVPPTFKLLVP